jgi:hypothetical protein
MSVLVKTICNLIWLSIYVKSILNVMNLGVLIVVCSLALKKMSMFHLLNVFPASLPAKMVNA